MTRMKTYLAIAAALMLAPFGHLQAASLGLSTTSPVIAADDVMVDYFEFFDDGSLFLYSSAITDTGAGAVASGATISLAIDFDVGTRTPVATSTVATSGALSGTVSSLGFVENTIEALVDITGGSAVGGFGSQALLTLDFGTGFGADPFAALSDGTSYTVDLSLANIAPVPLPASGLLLLAGVAGMAGLRRSKRV